MTLFCFALFMVTITFYVGEAYLRIPTRNRWEPKLGYFKGTYDKGVGGCRGNTRENARNLRFCYESNLCSLRRTWKIHRIREKKKQVTWIPATQREALLTPFGEFPSSFFLVSLENSFLKAHPESCMAENILHVQKYVEGNEELICTAQETFCFLS